MTTDNSKHRITNRILSSMCIFLIFCDNVECNGILESVKDSFSGLMNYTAEVLPYVHEGVKMVRRAEQFVDSAIGEDCTYECDREGV